MFCLKNPEIIKIFSYITSERFLDFPFILTSFTHHELIFVFGVATIRKQKCLKIPTRNI